MKADAYLLGAALALLLSCRHSMFVQAEVRKSLPPQFGELYVKLAMPDMVWTKTVSSEARRRHVIATSWGTLALLLMSVTTYRNQQDIPTLILIGMGLAGVWTAWRYLRRYANLDCKGLSSAQLIRLMLFGPDKLPTPPGSPTDGP